MEEKFDFDLTTKEGKLEAAKQINHALSRFNHNDKLFLTKLLFLMLDTVCQHEVKLEAIDEFINGISNLNK
jgi:hypothetical protein